MGTPAVDPGQVLFGATRRAILALLLGRPDERFHLRQVARLSGVTGGAVQRELASLVAAGIVRRESSGRQVYFQAERASPVFIELQGLIQKTAGAGAVVREALRSMAGRVRVAVIFGSVARGEVHAGSDVDLLVISQDLSVRELAGPIRHASLELGREVNLNLYKPEEWRARVAKEHRLVRSILEGPRLPVIGEPHDLERLAEERLGQAAQDQSRGSVSPVRRHRSGPSRERRRQRR